MKQILTDSLNHVTKGATNVMAFTGVEAITNTADALGVIAKILIFVSSIIPLFKRKKTA